MSGPNQHFVPQYYLKTFANDDGLYVFDKQKNCFLSNKRIPVDKIGFTKNFYDIDPLELSQYLLTETEDKYFIDKLLEKYNERISSPLINSFIALGEKVYRYKDLKILSLIRSDDIIDFLIVQLYRTPFFRKQFEFYARDVHKRNQDKIEQCRKHPVEKLASTIHGLYIISAICNTEIWKNNEKDHLLKPVFRLIDLDVTKQINQLKKMSKTIWVSSIDSCFVTSDNPIVISQSKVGEINMVFFPITRRCAITYWNVGQANRNVVIINENRKNVLLEQNRVMKDWAYRFIYQYDK